LFRLNRKITFDFAGRKVIEEDPSAAAAAYNPEEDEIVKQIMEETRKKGKENIFIPEMAKEAEKGIANPNISISRPMVNLLM